MDPSRRPLIAGNWKMNAGGADGYDLATEVARVSADFPDVEVLVGPPYTALAAVSEALREANADVGVAAQNMHEAANGAFTGEISADMLKVSGATWVILGHSERRQLFGEDDAVIKQKLAAANAAGLTAILCVGETLEQREAGSTLDVVGTQVRACAAELSDAGGSAVIAYEPVWAIGTGKVAEPSDAQEVHAAIRAMLREVSADLANSTRLLYGGSVKAQNAEGLLSQADIDGALVGGAALEAAGFGKIVEVASKLAQQDNKD
jgi:triosephosphate isomerase